MNRFDDLIKFYALLDRLKKKLGGTQTLAKLDNITKWPDRGVYFFYESSEFRKDSGDGPRIVRVGTHALTAGARSTLRNRLAQHRGKNSGGGNHRGSIFRLLIDQALITRGELPSCHSWGVKGDVGKAAQVLKLDRETVSILETPVEEAVSRYICAMPFLWLDVNDEPGPNSVRGTIERNAIALLSNYGREPLDPPSTSWLGQASDRPLVSGSGLWNQRHVDETHGAEFLNVLGSLI